MTNLKAKELHLKARRDLSEGKEELLRYLEKLPPQQFADITPETLARLTSADRQRLFSRAGRKQVQPQKGKRAVTHQPLPRKRYIVRLWYRLPILFRSLALASLSTGASVAVTVGLVTSLPLIEAHISTPAPLPSDPMEWPECYILTPINDGCTYRVEWMLNWNTAADLLQMPEADLRHHNSHLNHRLVGLLPNDLLVVWRSRLPLEER